MRVPARLLSALLLLFVFAAQGCGGDSDEMDGLDGSVEGDSAMVDTAAPTTSFHVEMQGVGGTEVAGTVSMAHIDGILQITYDLNGLEEGEHAMHIHENGSCADGEDGTPAGAAGGHFNPDSSAHGAPTDPAASRHAGDLGNITVGPDGETVGSIEDPVAQVSGPESILGKAVIIHEGVDDFTTQPTGGAGGRVACGIIEEVVEL